MRPRVLQVATSVLTLALVLAIGCGGPKAIKKESVLDTPENHFSRGMQELDKGNYAAAIEEFNRAKALNPNYAEAYAGLAMVNAEQGNFKVARELADQALGKNDKSVDVRILRGRVIAKQHEMDEKQDWIEDAVKEFNEAIKLNPQSAKAYYHLGVVYEKAYDFAQSANAFSKVIAMKSDYAAEADAEYAKIQKIQRAAPGTKVGAKVALIPEIDRGDLAVLLMEELKLMTLLEKKRPKQYETGFKPPEDVTKIQPTGPGGLPEVTDVDKHWAKNWIVELAKARVPGLEPGPDHMFHPNDKVTKAEYAMIMQSIVIMATGDQTLATKYVGEPSRFPDMNSSHFAYNAVALMTERGVLSAETLSGEFRPNDHISGADALLAIRQFQNAFSMKF